MLDRNDEPFADDPEGLKQYQAYLRLKARCKEMAREWREEKKREEQKDQ